MFESKPKIVTLDIIEDIYNNQVPVKEENNKKKIREKKNAENDDIYQAGDDIQWL